LFVPVAAAVLLAGVSPNAAALFDPDFEGEDGRLELQTAKDLDGFHFRLQKWTVDPNTNIGAWKYVMVGTSPNQVPLEQGFTVDKGCTIRQAGPMLGRLTPYKNGTGGDLGYVATSLGVYDGPQGTACGRVSKSKNESISFAVGDASELNGANAFDMLELDIEVKGDVWLELVVNFDGVSKPYYLKAGGDFDASLLNDGEVFGPENPLAGDTYYCRSSSDSGPDSGPSDNCRWKIKDLGRSFTINPISGEFSLEGGGDFFGAATERTFVYLTSIDGYLDCNLPITTTGDGVTCDATRLDAPGEVCTKVPYVFRATFDGERQYCILEADMGSQQRVVNIFTTYDKELQQEPEFPIGSTKVWEAAALSQIKFDTSNVPVPIPPCLGLTLTYPEGEVEPLPIPKSEVQPLDRVSGGFIEFACAFMREETFGTDDTSNENWTRIREGIQFWGDPQLSRPGGGFSQ